MVPISIFLCLIFFFEGLGLKYGQGITFFIIIFTPVLLFYKSKKIYFPKKITILYLIFLFLSLLSTITSVNTRVSFEFWLILSASFFFLVYSFNNQDAIKKILPIILLLLSFLLIISSIFIIKITTNPQTVGYQLVYPTFSSHNHLGDFLILSILILVYLIFKAKKTSFKILCLLALLLSLPFFIFSFSRSAYISLLLCFPVLLYFILKGKNKIYIFLTTLILTLGIIFLFISTTQNIKISQSFQNIFSKQYFLQDKPITGARESYLNEAFYSILNRPIFGVGPGNFIFASNQYADNASLIASSSHNIFVDILVENGIIAGALFLIIIILLFKNSKLELTTILAVALLINFQTDYTYKIMPVFILFFILIGASLQHKDTLEIRSKILLGSILLSIFGILILLSNFFINYSLLSLSLYPLNEAANLKLLTTSRDNDLLIKIYRFNLKEDRIAMENLAQYYEKVGNIDMAIYYYQKEFTIYTWDFRPAKKAYSLLLAYKKRGDANKYISRVFKLISEKKNKKNDKTHLFKNSFDFCVRINAPNCQQLILN